MNPVTNSALVVCGLLAIGCATNASDVPDPSDVPEPPGASGEPGTPTSSTGLETVALDCDITPAIDWMNSQEIVYAQSPSEEWRDCSGNFLRLSSRIADLCPGVDLPAPAGIAEYIHGGNNTRPGPEEARTTRGLAEWYDKKGLFVPVYYDEVDDKNSAPASLVAFRNRIRPGTVLWFSPETPRKADGKPALYREGRDAKRGVINHMGTVASVERDDDGNVTGWTMYHGQNERKNNGVTEHFWEKQVGRTMTVPQGGYGEQRIVGYSMHLIPEVAALVAAE